jgi:hypothetical protein
VQKFRLPATFEDLLTSYTSAPQKACSPQHTENRAVAPTQICGIASSQALSEVVELGNGIAGTLPARADDGAAIVECSADVPREPPPQPVRRPAENTPAQPADSEHISDCANEKAQKHRRSADAAGSACKDSIQTHAASSSMASPNALQTASRVKAGGDVPSSGETATAGPKPPASSDVAGLPAHVGVGQQAGCGALCWPEEPCAAQREIAPCAPDDCSVSEIAARLDGGIDGFVGAPELFKRQTSGSDALNPASADCAPAPALLAALTAAQGALAPSLIASFAAADTSFALARTSAADALPCEAQQRKAHTMPTQNYMCRV